MRRRFMSEVTKTLNDLERSMRYVKESHQIYSPSMGSHFSIVTRAHGPAVQLDVMKANNSLWYELDFVPGFEVKAIIVSFHFKNIDSSINRDSLRVKFRYKT